MATALQRSRVTRSWCCFFTTGSITAAYTYIHTYTRAQRLTCIDAMRRLRGKEYRKKKVPACAFSAGEPLRSRISRSTRPRDMRPRVRPDIMPAKRTSKHEIPAYMNHHTDPKGMPSLPSTGTEWSRVNIRATINALTTLIVSL